MPRAKGIHWNGFEYVGQCTCGWRVGELSLADVREQVAAHVCEAPAIVPEVKGFVSGLPERCR